MYVVKFFRNLLSYIARFILTLLGWLIIVPIIFFIPKNKKKIAVIGRDGGKFLDNTKYFYLQSQNSLSKPIKCTFITEHKEVYNLLKEKDLPVLYYFSVKAYLYCIRANIIIVDSFDWSEKLRLFLTFGSKRIQLWHGVGFKRIELDNLNNTLISKKKFIRSILYKIKYIYQRIIGRQVAYSVVNTTSNFYRDNVFKKAFKAQFFTTFGYSRNSFDNNNLYELNTDFSLKKKLDQWILGEKKIIVVVPTFRDSRRTPLNLNPDNLRLIDKWCDLNNAVFLFKFHPWERGASDIIGKSIFKYSHDADIYPLLKYSFAMITDYSSIYMDYLLLNKPIVFLVPDIEEYVSKDRNIQFNFEKMTPGEKVKTWSEVLHILDNQDLFSEERRKLAYKAFDGQSQADATCNLIMYFEDRNWLRLK